MPDSTVELDELVDLKMLPAWVNEPAPTERYAGHEGEDQRERRSRDRRPRDKRGPDRTHSRPGFDRPTQKGKMPGRPLRQDRRPPRAQDRHRKDRPGFVDRQSSSSAARISDRPLPPIAVKFLPRVSAFENVVAQIKSGSVAYSLFALARLFLEKATRHDVQLTAPPESPLFQLGENGDVSVDRQFLERNAFRFAKADFYKVDITETEPIKGNFTNVARCRLSGTLLGPTNHHDYQRRLRNLYEQRFSRRMSFADYQRQIQIVTDPAEIEKWKEDARKVTTFSTLRDETPTTFSSAAETERHFQQNYLPGLVRSASELTIDGPASRHLQDRVLNRLIENEWTRETRSPSPMMQELAARFREAGLHVFRHRRGMLFVSSIYPRPFKHDESGVSPQVRAILESIGTSPRIGRKELADKLIAGLTADEAERVKMALASDLRWLINEGYVIEFNDGSLDLPRAKAKAKESAEAATPEEKAEEKAIVANVPAAEKEQRVEAGAPPADELPEAPNETKEVVAADIGSTESRATEEETEIGGS
ncbi:MAG TPA: hypothetical protein VMO04_04590 [Chthoniobacterales bacterium]|nr:hypothetical protein [Chthoniobacterales bacterium]